MMLIRLIAYVLLNSIFPVVTEFTTHEKGRSVELTLWLLVAMTGGLCAYGGLSSWRSRSLRATWNGIWNSESAGGHRLWQRGNFLLIVVLTVLSSLCAVLSIQGGTDAQDTTEGSGTVANLVDTLGTFVFTMALTFLCERRFWKKLHRMALIRMGLVLLAMAGSVVFVVAKEDPTRIDVKLLRRPEVIFAALWALLGAVNMQLTRGFATAGVAREGFLFWRFLGPFVIMLGVLAYVRGTSPSPIPFDLTLALGMFALGLAYIAAVLLQFDLLRTAPAAVVGAAGLAKPGVTYLIALALYLGGAPGIVSIGSAAVVVASLYLAKTLPENWQGGRATWRSITRGVWGDIFRDPTLSFSVWLLLANVVGLALTLCLFGPPVAALLGETREALVPDHPHLFGQLVMLGVLMLVAFQLFSMSLLARKVRDIMKDRMLEAFNREATFRAHIFKRLFENGLDIVRCCEPRTSDQDVRQKLEVARENFRFGLRLSQDLCDVARAAARDEERPSLQLSVCGVRQCLEEQFSQLRTLIHLNGAELEKDFEKVLDHLRWKVDADRLFIIWYNLVLNACDAWAEHCDRTDYTGLRITLRANYDPTDGNWVRLSVRDTGPGFPAPVEGGAFDAWLSTKPGGHGLGLYICKLYVQEHGGVLPDSNDSDGDHTGGAIVPFKIPILNPDSVS